MSKIDVFEKVRFQSQNWQENYFSLVWIAIWRSICAGLFLKVVDFLETILFKIVIHFTNEDNESLTLSFKNQQTIYYV